VVHIEDIYIFYTYLFEKGTKLVLSDEIETCIYLFPLSVFCIFVLYSVLFTVVLCV